MRRKAAQYFRSAAMLLLAAAVISAYRGGSAGSKSTGLTAIYAALVKTVSIGAGEGAMDDGEAIFADASYMFSYPLTGKVTVRFGAMSMTPSGMPVVNHGIDIKAENGSGRAATARAAADGTVTESGVDPRYGIYIMLSHEGGYISIYSNLKNIAAGRGDMLDRGAEIGTARDGTLHFEIWRGVTAEDPEQLLAHENKD